jgi:two-component system, cell cycle sensor histidine kinase and response regulator CckA
MTQASLALLAAPITGIAIVDICALAGAFVYFMRKARRSEANRRDAAQAPENQMPFLELFEQSNVLLWWAKVTREGSKLKWVMRTPSRHKANPIYRLAGCTALDGLWNQEHSPDYDQMGKTADTAISSGAGGYQQEFRINGDDGVHWMNEEVVIRTEGANEWSLAGVVTDVTKRHDAETAKSTTEDQLNQILKGADCLLWQATVTGDPDDQIQWQVYVPPSALYKRIFGEESKADRDREEMTEAMVPEWDDIQKTSRRALKENKAGYEQEYHVNNRGKTFLLHETVKISRVAPDRWNLVGVTLDVTEQRKAESALRESEQRFRQVTENIDEVFWLNDIDKQELVYVSPAYTRIWGRPVESLYGVSKSWLDAIHPGDRERVRQAALTLQVTGEYDIEYRILRPDGTERWIHDRAFPIRDAEGRVHRVAGVANDTTVKRQLEEAFRQSQKIEAVGQLAGGIAHDFNNLLVAIQLQASLLIDDNAGHSKNREGLQEILASVERAANLTRQLLTFSRRYNVEKKDFDLAEVIGTLTKLLRGLVGENIAVESSFAPKLPLINGDSAMMEQVLINLTVNARDAMPDGGELKLSLFEANVDAAYAATRPHSEVGRYVCLEVSDTGTGIAPENLPRIFEPFFTTKDVGKGTGLGLATVLGIVQQHHGWIDVQSTVGKGTTFRAYFPALAATALPSASVRVAKPIKGGSESILIVEDDATVRKLAQAVLERYGYRVIECEDAVTALKQWKHLESQVDLLLTDLVMPGGVSGHELAERLLARRPGLRVIYTSGYDNDVVNRQLHDESNGNFLQKPYSVALLAETVRRVLDRPAP